MENFPKERDKRAKQLFTSEEDEKIRVLVAELGDKSWIQIASILQNRTARQVRERWKYYLNPSAACSPWTHEEEALLIKLHDLFGPDWSKLATYIPNKTRISVKNRWNYIKRNYIENNNRKRRGRKSKVAITEVNSQIMNEKPQINADSGKTNVQPEIFKNFNIFDDFMFAINDESIFHCHI